MKRWISCLLIACMALLLTACGDGGYKVKSLMTLVEQEYSIAFRNNDGLSPYVVAAIEVLNAEGKVDELSRKWFGQNIIHFGKDAEALDKLPEPPEHNLLLGVDINSFPMAYMQNGNFWGYDVELASFVCEKLGWTLQVISIEKENVYVELYSGNIDCAWGGIALNKDELAKGSYSQYGPYVDNDIIVVARDGSRVWNSLRLSGRNMAMCTTPEAMAALQTDEKLMKRLGQITRLAGGTTECFAYLYAGNCDAVLTDSTAMYYYNSH